MLLITTVLYFAAAEFQPINTLVQLDLDLPLAKMSASNICYIKRKVNELIDSQLLISNASNMYM